MSFDADCTPYATRKQVTFLQQPTKKIAILIVASTNTAVKPLIDPEGNI